MHVLDTTLSTRFVPGTNLSDDRACADWRFLLPTFPLDNLLFLGTPSMANLSVLSAIGRRVIVVSTDHRRLQDIQQASRQQGIKNLELVRVDQFARLPFPPRTMGLIWLTGGAEVPRPVRSPGILAELERLLQADGVVYFELRGVIDNLLGHQTSKGFGRYGFASRQLFWQTPHSGEMRTAVPLGDNAMGCHFFAHVLYGQSPRKRALSRLGELFSRLGLLPYLSLRRGVLLQRAPVNGRPKQAPPYLVSLARKAGIDLGQHRCGLSARGNYNSNKVVFYLFEPAKTTPAVVVKMTRFPEYNDRLEHEYRALSLLAERGYVGPETFPQPLFLDYYNNLALLGLKAVNGQPFRKRTRANVHCPIARDAINWIVQLGAASADCTLATPKKVADILTNLFTQVTAIYPLTENEKSFLLRQVAALGSARTAIPLVFQHGDAGAWNIVVSDDDRVTFLDWETAEPQGMPLWDLFYFMRSFATWVSRRQGDRDTLAAFERLCLTPSPLSALLTQATERYCDQVGVDKHLVEPLFYTCWLHRALKESILVPADSLQEAHYFNLLRLCIRRRNTPALQALFAETMIGEDPELSRPMSGVGGMNR
jgi:hypothetical protein